MSGNAIKEEQVGPEAVYSEMYSEMRRFRDYQFTSSSWYTTFLLAILGYLITMRFGENACSFQSVLAASLPIKVLFITTAILIAAASSFLIRYTHRRYRHIRDWVTKELEPDWEKRSFREDRIYLTPHRVYYLTQWILALLICLAVLT